LVKYLWLPLFAAGLFVSPAWAEMFPPSPPSGPPMATSPSGFVGVIGPHGEAPELHKDPVLQHAYPEPLPGAHADQHQADPTHR